MSIQILLGFILFLSVIEFSFAIEDYDQNRNETRKWVEQATEKIIGEHEQKPEEKQDVQEPISQGEKQCKGPHEVYACGSACQTTCKTLRVPCPIINVKCNDACFCIEGYARDLNGICISIKHCKAHLEENFECEQNNENEQDNEAVLTIKEGQINEDNQNKQVNEDNENKQVNEDNENKQVNEDNQNKQVKEDNENKQVKEDNENKQVNEDHENKQVNDDKQNNKNKQGNENKQGTEDKQNKESKQHNIDKQYNKNDQKLKAEVVNTTQAPITCTRPHEIYNCGSACQTECATLGKPCPIINIACNHCCYCKDGYARNFNGRCIPTKFCPKLGSYAYIQNSEEENTRKYC